MIGKIWYCLEFYHSGPDGRPAPIDDDSRVFVSGPNEAKGCPECPICKKQVSASEIPDERSRPPQVVSQVTRSVREYTNTTSR